MISTSTIAYFLAIHPRHFHFLPPHSPIQSHWTDKFLKTYCKFIYVLSSVWLLIYLLPPLSGWLGFSSPALKWLRARTGWGDPGVAWSRVRLNFLSAASTSHFHFPYIMLLPSTQVLNLYLQPPYITFTFPQIILLPSPCTHHLAWPRLVSFTNPLASGSEAGNLSRPRYATLGSPHPLGRPLRRCHLVYELSLQYPSKRCSSIGANGCSINCWQSNSRFLETFLHIIFSDSSVPPSPLSPTFPFLPPSTPLPQIKPTIHLKTHRFRPVLLFLFKAL